MLTPAMLPKQRWALHGARSNPYRCESFCWSLRWARRGHENNVMDLQFVVKSKVVRRYHFFNQISGIKWEIKSKVSMYHYLYLYKYICIYTYEHMYIIRISFQVNRGNFSMSSTGNGVVLFTNTKNMEIDLTRHRQNSMPFLEDLPQKELVRVRKLNLQMVKYKYKWSIYMHGALCI